MKPQRMARLVTILILVGLCLTPALSLASGPGPGSAYEVRFTGVIDGAPAAEGDPWQVAGYTVYVDAETRVRLTTGIVAAGMWATVIADRDESGALVASQITVMPPEVRLKGPISAIPEGRIGTWVVAGQSINVTEETRFNERGGPLAAGGWAELYMLEEPAGSLTALRIRSIEFQEEVEVLGVIRTFDASSWVLSTIPLTVTDDTITTGAPQVSLVAHAAAEIAADDALLARNIRIYWQEPGGLRQAVQFRGTVESLPESGLTGTWIISGREVQVTDATSIIQTKALVDVGSLVHVVAWEAGSVLQAVQVTVLNGNLVGPAFHYAGEIEALPHEGLVGNWTIAGYQVQVTQQTRITGAQHARVGAPAEVGGLRLQNGAHVATWLRIRASSGPGPGGTETPEPQHTPVATPGGPNPSRTPGRP